MPPKRYREGSPNTVLQPMSSSEQTGNSQQSGNNMNVNSGNMRNLLALARQAGRQAEQERLAKKTRTTQPQPNFVGVATKYQRAVNENYQKLIVKRNSLPRGLLSLFNNTKLRNAASQGKYQNMNAQLNSKLKLANNHERRITNLLKNLPNGNFKTNATNKINNVIGNNTKTTALLQKIKNEKNRLNATATAAQAASRAINKTAARNGVPLENLKAKKKAAAAAAQAANAANARARNVANRKRRITNLLKILPNGNFKTNATNKINNVIGNNTKTTALLQKIKNEKNRINAAAANKARANANAKARANANANAKARANANANAKARANANANAKAKAAAQAELNNRMSGRTSCPTNIRPLIQKLNNYENTASSPKILKSQEMILLEILALSKENADNRNNDVGKKHRAYVYALLYDMFSVGLPKTFFRAGMKITRKTLITLAKHLMCANTYSSSSNNFKAQEFTLTDMQITEFLFLMWLDGWHDDYNETSFETFLPTLAGKNGYFKNRYITNSWNTMKSIVPENLNEKIKNINQDKLISKIINKINAIRPFIYDKTFKELQNTAAKSKSKNKTPKLKGRFETVLRVNITELLGYKLNSNKIMSGNASRPSINANNKHMVLLDMEGPQQRLSRTINNSPNLYPYLASASLIDPGRFKLGYYELANDITHIRSWVAEEKRNQTFLDFNTRYHVGPTNMILKDSAGNTFLNVNLTVNLRGVAQNKINKVNNNSFFTLKLNDKEVDIRTAAKNAKGAGIEIKMGKFMGDALQYMTVIVQNNTRSRNRVFASGDGNACFMYMHLCKCIGQTPRIIIDNTSYTTYHGIE